MVPGSCRGVAGEEAANFPAPLLRSVQVVGEGHELGAQAEVATDDLEPDVGRVQAGGQQVDVGTRHQRVHAAPPASYVLQQGKPLVVGKTRAAKLHVAARPD